QPLTWIRHIDALHAELASGHAVRMEQVALDGATVDVAIDVPPGADGRALPLLLRVGHPANAQHTIYSVRELRAMRSLPPQTVVVATNLLARLAPEELPVDDPSLVARVPRIFHALVDHLLATLPVSRDRVTLFGFSYDGVWAWALALAEPERYH